MATVSTYFSASKHTTLLTHSLASKNHKVAVYIDGKTIALAAGGKIYRAPATSSAARIMATALHESGRQAWSVEPLHRTATRLVKLTPEFDTRSIRNATAAEAAVIGDPKLRAAGNREETGSPRTAPVNAVAIALTAADMLEGQEPHLRKLALRAVQLDLVWRHRIVEGWPVDLATLQAEVADAEHERVRIQIEASLDLTADQSQQERKASFAWLDEAGLYPTNRAGEPTLEGDELKASIPEGAEAERRLGPLSFSTQP